MAEKKISEFTAKGATVANADLLAISEYVSPGVYTSKFIKGEELLPTKVGQSLKVLRVNAAETALEWETPAGGGGTHLGNTDLTSNRNVAKFTLNGSTSANTFEVWNGTRRLLTVLGDGSVFNLGGGGVASNLSFGSGALVENTTGYANLAIGSLAMTKNDTGYSNVAIGNNALRFGTASRENIAIGGGAAINNNSIQNTIIGSAAFISSYTGSRNTVIGCNALENNASGGSNVVVGMFAGRYFLGSNALIIDNNERTNVSGELANALIFGTFAATAADQRFRINASVGINGAATATSKLNITGLPTSASGLVAGDVWSNSGILTIV